MDRREFIKKAGRIAALSTIGAISGYAIFKNTQGETCLNRFVCSKCKSLDKCNLPEAKAYKENGEKR